jgi:hypothetical protein
MARTQSTTTAPKTTTPKSRRVKTLSEKAGTTIYYPSPDLAVVVARKRGGAGGGLGVDDATIDICKCVRMEYRCTTTGSHTTCKEVCAEWDCTTMPMLI